MRFCRTIIYPVIVGVAVSVMLSSVIQSINREDDSQRRGILYARLESVDQLFQDEFDCSAVPPVVYTRVVSLAPLPVWKRKEAFVRIVLPSILIAEEEIKAERKRLVELLERMKLGETLTREEAAYIKGLLKKYRTESFDELLVRLNTHPPSIILGQAALESGWGVSRFFVEANNIFGIWTFKRKGGLKAINSEARLARYRDTLSAVKSYLYNINVGWAYGDFRQFRSREAEPIKLVSYLDKYSILGEQYVQRLSDVIEINNLDRYDSCRLASLSDYKEKKAGDTLLRRLLQLFD